MSKLEATIMYLKKSPMMRCTFALIAVVLVAVVMVSICMAGAEPDRHWEPATTSLTYSVSVPTNVPFKITRSWGTNTSKLYLVHDYLAFHRASFLKCVRDYIQGKSIVLVGDTRPIIDYPISDRAWVGGHKLAQEQLEKLEKDVGKEKLIQRLKDEGYGEVAGTSGFESEGPW
jgi:hypothetical protein